MEGKLSPAHEQMFWRQVMLVAAVSRLEQCRRFIQHGDTSVYRHCIAVAYLSCLLAERLHLRVDWPALVRGALLHDYFLYDWHEKAAWHRLHGFRHPGFALRNARQDFSLSPREEDIILRHMFPLTPMPPTCREAWLVCLADKLCSLRETARLTSPGYGCMPVQWAAAQHRPV